MSSAHGHLEYRPDIDGLRAIAVLPVVFFHAGMVSFRGGYVGVDIFFVISGYLITSLILRDQAENDFSIIKFYERRVRRIIPALFAMLLFVLVFSAVFYLPFDFEQNGRALLSAVAFVANFEFLNQAGYFNPAAQYKPLLHTWSLSIEEQFYVLYPALLILLKSWKRFYVVATLCTLLLASLTLCIVETRLHVTAAFFLTPTRAWELLIGCVVAFLPRPVKWPRWILEIMSSGGIAAIVYSVYSRSHVGVFDFPGYAALIPCCGAALLIYGNSSGVTLAKRMLSLRLIVGVGLISYSLYLWHWPIFAFARIWSPIELTFPLQVSLIAASFVAAVASWHWIEKPFRNRQGVFPRRKLFFATASVAALFSVCGIAAVASQGWSGRFAPEVAEFAKYKGYVTSAAWRQLTRNGACDSTDDNAGDFHLDECLSGVPGRPNILLWGDSHAAHFSQPLAQLAGANGMAILQVTRPGCLPATSLEMFDGTGCEEFSRYILQQLTQKRIDGVILSAEWPRGEGADEREQVIAAIVETVQHALALDIPVIVVGPSPRYAAPLADILARYSASGSSSLFSPDTLLDTEMFAWDAAMKEALGRKSGVIYVSLTDALCRGQKCQTLVDGKIPLQWDSNHFTLEGSEFVVREALTKPLLSLRHSEASKETGSTE